jgi:restriction system protein
VVTGGQNVSKGVITTTSDFAPGIVTDPILAPHIPFRLELKSGALLLEWLEELPGEVRVSD